jgi:hypothetical protein
MSVSLNSFLFTEPAVIETKVPALTALTNVFDTGTGPGVVVPVFPIVIEAPAVSLSLNVFVFLFEIAIVPAVAFTSPVNVFIAADAGSVFVFAIVILVPAVSAFWNSFVFTEFASIETKVPAFTGSLNKFATGEESEFDIVIEAPAVTVLLNVFVFIPDITTAPVLAVTVLNRFTTGVVAPEFAIVITVPVPVALAITAALNVVGADP